MQRLLPAVLALATVLLQPVSLLAQPRLQLVEASGEHEVTDKGVRTGPDGRLLGLWRGALLELGPTTEAFDTQYGLVLAYGDLRIAGGPDAAARLALWAHARRVLLDLPVPSLRVRDAEVVVRATKEGRTLTVLQGEVALPLPGGGDRRLPAGTRVAVDDEVRELRRAGPGATAARTGLSPAPLPLPLPPPDYAPPPLAESEGGGAGELAAGGLSGGEGVAGDPSCGCVEADSGGTAMDPTGAGGGADIEWRGDAQVKVHVRFPPRQP